MEITGDLMQELDKQRLQHNFLTIGEMLKLVRAGNTLFDFNTILISRYCQLGSGNIFYPNVIIEVRNEGKLTIGNNNVFYPNSLLLADKGSLIIGSGNQFGEGGCSIKAIAENSSITIGDKGRYMNGVQILGQCKLGTGSQILGRLLTVQNCDLGEGGSFEEENADLRGAVLKGFGVANNLKLERGQVINGQGNFDMANVQNQSFYHPPKSYSELQKH